MHLDVRSVTHRAEHPRQFDRLPGDHRRLPPGHREPRLAEKRRRAGLRPHQPGADRCRRSCCARSGTAPVPQRQSHAQPLLEAAEPGQARARRAGRRAARARRGIRPSCHCSGNARSAAVPSWPAQDPLDHLRSRREPARRRGAKDAHDYRRRVISVTNPASPPSTASQPHMVRTPAGPVTRHTPRPCSASTRRPPPLS